MTILLDLIERDRSVPDRDQVLDALAEISARLEAVVAQSRKSAAEIARAILCGTPIAPARRPRHLQAVRSES